MHKTSAIIFILLFGMILIQTNAAQTEKQKPRKDTIAIPAPEEEYSDPDWFQFIPPALNDPVDGGRYRRDVDEPARIIGGLDSLMKHLVYPALARRAGVEGRVTVAVYVDKAGWVRKAMVIRGIGGGCDEAAVRAIKRVRFTPAQYRGKPVHSVVQVPVEFRLGKKQEQMEVLPKDI